MSSENPGFNRIGMPPPGRTVHRRRAQLEAEAEERGEGPIDSRRQLVVSMISFGVVLAIGLLLAWIVL